MGEQEKIQQSVTTEFEKKEYVFVDDIGVCRVDEITKLTQKDGTAILYYGFRSAMIQTKTAYIPVENHEKGIRKLISVEDARAYLELPKEQQNELLSYEARFVITKEKKDAEKKAEKAAAREATRLAKENK